MKSERGLTLASVIVYIFALMFVVTMITVLTGYFYKNISMDTETTLVGKQYTKFNSYFSEDINKKGNRVIDAGSRTEEIDGEIYDTNYITFSSGNTYVYSSQNCSIYFNNVKICTLVDKCTFDYEFVDSVYEITLEFEAGNFKKSGSDALKFYIRSGA